MAAAPRDRFVAAAASWPEDEEFYGQADPEALADFLLELERPRPPGRPARRASVLLDLPLTSAGPRFPRRRPTDVRTQFGTTQDDGGTRPRPAGTTTRPAPGRVRVNQRRPGGGKRNVTTSGGQYIALSSSVATRRKTATVVIGGHVAPVTPGYSESGHQDPGSRYCRVGRASQGSCETHRNPTTPRHGGRSPQESRGRNGTLRYTFMRVKGTENSRSAASMRVSWAAGAFSRCDRCYDRTSPVTSKDAGELGCINLLASALGCGRPSCNR